MIWSRSLDAAIIAVWDKDMDTIPTKDLKTHKCEMTLFHGRSVCKADCTFL